MNIKKIIISFLLLSFLIIGPAMAINIGGDQVQDAAVKAGFKEGTTETTFAETIGLFIRIALSLVGMIFLILTVYAGILWMTARGEEEQIKKAQRIIVAAIIGLIITVSAYSITNFVVPAILERTASGNPSL